MDYIRIKTIRLQDYKTKSIEVTEPVEVPIAHNTQLTAKEVKDLLKDWIKLYPNSFAPDVEFKIYQLADGDIIIELHDDLSSMAVSLLVLYFNSIGQQPIDNSTNSRDVSNTSSPNNSRDVSNTSIEYVAAPTAYITIDDAEVLLKQNEGKRAMIISCRDSQPCVCTSVRFILEDNCALDYNFEKRPQLIKDCDMKFEELEFSLPEEYEIVKVGDVVKKKIDEILDEGLTPKKMLMYFLCGAIGLSIGFLIVYFMSK